MKVFIKALLQIFMSVILVAGTFGLGLLQPQRAIAKPAAQTTNLALNRPVTCSSTETATFPCTAAVDGNAAATRWSSAFSDPQWIYVDLGATTAIGSVTLRWEAA